MVTFIPSRDEWAEAGRQLGGGAVEAYMNRADEGAIQKAIGALGPNPSARQLLDAITNTKTYSNQAKQQVFENYLGLENIEETRRKAKEQKEFQDKQQKALEDYRQQSLNIQSQKNQSSHKRIHSVGDIKSGLQTIKEMKDLGKKGNLGFGLGVRKLYSKEALKDSYEYERLGKSLIQLATTIPIRNRQEFEVLSHDLFDPNIRDAGREGILTAMENLLTRSLQEQELEGNLEQSTQTEGKVRVRNKQTGIVGTVTPYEGMEDEFERI